LFEGKGKEHPRRMEKVEDSSGGDEVRRLPKSVLFFFVFFSISLQFFGGRSADYNSVQALAYGECWPEVGLYKLECGALEYWQEV
jgi:hypothetical protein